MFAALLQHLFDGVEHFDIDQGFDVRQRSADDEIRRVQDHLRFAVELIAIIQQPQIAVGTEPPMSALGLHPVLQLADDRPILQQRPYSRWRPATAHAMPMAIFRSCSASVGARNIKLVQLRRNPLAAPAFLLTPVQCHDPDANLILVLHPQLGVRARLPDRGSVRHRLFSSIRHDTHPDDAARGLTAGPVTLASKIGLSLDHSHGELVQKLAALAVREHHLQVFADVSLATASRERRPIGKYDRDARVDQGLLKLHALTRQLRTRKPIGHVDQHMADLSIGNRVLTKCRQASAIQISTRNPIVQINVLVVIQLVGQHVVQVIRRGIQAQPSASGFGDRPVELRVDTSPLLARATTNVNTSLVQWS